MRRSAEPRAPAPRRAGRDPSRASACSASTTRVAELDERVAGDDVRDVGASRHGRGATTSSLPSFSLSSRTMRSAVFLPIPGIAWKRAGSPSAIARRSSSGERARDDGERNLRPDAAHTEEVDEELALRSVGEPVELQRVLADVQVRLERRPRRVPAARRSALGVAATQVADAAHVEDEPVRRASGRRAAQAGDHPATSSSGGASAWQIATASASAACDDGGSASSLRMIFTIRCICPFSARP